MSQGNHPSIIGEADAPADERVASVLDGVFDPFLLLEAVRDDHGDLIDLRVTAANPPACAGMGVDPGSIVGALLPPLLTEDERTTLLPLYRRVIETGEPLVLDGIVMRYPGPDGGARRFDVRALRIGDGLSVSWRDVTRRWEEREALTAARRALAASEHRYRTIAELSTDFVIELDADMRVTWASSSITPVTGWRPEEVVGFTPMDLAPPEDAATTENHARDGLSGHVVRGRRRVRTRDGSSRWMFRSIRPVIGDDGRVTGLVTGFRDIQAEVEAEEALAAGAARFHQTVDGLVDPLIIMHPVHDEAGGIVDFEYVYANPAACAYNGRSLEQTVGRRLYELFPALVDDGVAEVYARVMLTGEPWSLDDHAYTFRWGEALETRYTDVRAFRVGGDLVLSWRDVTRAYHAQEALRESESRYRLLADSASDIVFLTLADSTLTWISPSVKAVLGWEPTQLLGRPARELVHPDDLPGWQERNETLERDGHVTAEMRYRRSDGSYRWLSIVLTAVRDADGRFVSQTGIARDISAEHAARQELEASRAELAEAQRLAHVGSWSSHVEDGRIRWSDELFRIAGIEPAADVPDWSAQLGMFTEATRGPLEAAVTRLQADGTPFAVDGDAIGADGQVRHLVVRGEAVRDEDGRIVRLRGTISDLTELVEATLRIQQLNDDLERRVQERTEELETFTYTLSHDLRAPLRWINGFAAMLDRRDGDKLDQTSHHYLEEIRNASDRMGRLFEELLDYSRLGRQAVRLTTVEWPPILEALRATFAPRIAASGATLDIQAPLLSVVGDPMLLERILVNLVDNGLTYVPADRPGTVTIATQRTGRRVRVMVRDRGIGIAEEHRDRIFSPFVRLNDADTYPGTGIGLAIVARAARLMGSRVEVESVPGDGSAFSFELAAVD